MAVASSRVTSLAINQPVTDEDLGGWRMHTRVSGLVDEAFNTDEECLDALKRYLSYMPSHCGEAPPVVSVPKGSDDAVESIMDIVPGDRKKVYNMRHVVDVLADKFVDSFSSDKSTEAYGAVRIQVAVVHVVR